MKPILKTAMIAVAMAAIIPAVHAGTSDKITQDDARVLFQTGATPACAICHTLKDADSTGTIGPDLDELKPSLEQIKKALKEGLGVMPSFEESMTEEQRNAVALYVFHATHSDP